MTPEQRERKNQKDKERRARLKEQGQNGAVQAQEEPMNTETVAEPQSEPESPESTVSTLQLAEPETESSEANNGPTRDFVNIPLIRTDAGTQMRSEGLHKPTVEKYRELLRDALSTAENGNHLDEAGVGNNVLDHIVWPFPPIVVFHDGEDYFPGDGHHRIEAHRLENIPIITSLIYEGTLDDAKLWACGANENHGLPRTSADIKKAVTTVLMMKPDASDRSIARICSTNPVRVATVREEYRRAQQYVNPPAEWQEDPLPDNGIEIEQKTEKEPEKRVGADGRVRSMPAKKGSKNIKVHHSADEMESMMTEDEWLATLPLVQDFKKRGLEPPQGLINDALTYRTLMGDGDLGGLQRRIARSFDFNLSCKTPLEMWAQEMASLKHPREWYVCPCPNGDPDVCRECFGAGYQLTHGRKPEGDVK